MSVSGQTDTLTSPEGYCYGSIGGFGAVMGSKNLKALAVQGTGKPDVSDRERLKELNRYTVNLSRRFVPAIPPGMDSRVKVTGKGGKCYQCALECVRNVYQYGEGFEDNRRCQSMVYYLPGKYSRDDEPIETLFDAPTLANDYSIDTIELEQIIDWLYACYREGILTEQETGLPLSRIGTREFLEKLLHAIAYREGFGDILADGLWRTGEKVSKADGEKIDFDQCGERIFNVQRLIMLREGRKLPGADFPAEHNFTEPLESGMHGGPTLVPGPGEEAIDVTGNILDRNRFKNMLKEYYGLRGWDQETGQFRSETLTALGLDDLLPSGRA